jgi:hypothetical protein
MKKPGIRMAQVAGASDTDVCGLHLITAMPTILPKCGNPCTFLMVNMVGLWVHY